MPASEQYSERLGFAVRDRILELIRVAPSELRDHPDQWKVHPDLQESALESGLRRLGQTGTGLCYRSDGSELGPAYTGQLIKVDGHLRTATAPDILWPMLLLDLTDAEGREVLLTHDALTMVGLTDIERYGELAERVDPLDGPTEALIAAMLAEGRYEVPQADGDDADGDPDPPDPGDLHDSATDDAGFVAFHFGDYKGKVTRLVYDLFVERYRKVAAKLDTPTLDDVLMAYLGLDRIGDEADDDEEYEG